MATIIRCSSLSHYTDCPRRSAAKMFFNELSEEYGFDLTPTKTSAGAAVGTAMHKSLEAAIVLRSKGQPYAEEIKKVAEASIIESAREGIIWDDTTFDKSAGVLQAVRQAHAILDVFPELDEIAIEGEFTADLGDDFVLSGHIDIRGREGQKHTIQDFKSGTVKRVNIPQYGGYSLLVRTAGQKVDLLREIYVKRVGKTKAQPAPIVQDYDPAMAENFAYAIIKKIKSDLQAFRKSGSPWVWLPNPNSMMCSPHYCPAYGTKFCKCKTKETENVK